MRWELVFWDLNESREIHWLCVFWFMLLDLVSNAADNWDNYANANGTASLPGFTVSAFLTRTETLREMSASALCVYKCVYGRVLKRDGLR